MCLMGYGVTIFVSLALLRELDTSEVVHRRVFLAGLQWMGMTLSLFLIQLRQLSQCFSLGEMIVCAELLSTLLCFVFSSQISISTITLHDAVDPRQLLYFISYLTTLSLLFSVFTCLAIRQWSVDWLHGIHGLTFRKKQNRVFSLVVHTLSFVTLLALFQHRSCLIDVLTFSLGSKRKKWLVMYWVLILAVGTWSAQILKTKTRTIIMRKWFHCVAICLFLPAYFMEPIFLQISLGAALVAFILIEGIRLSCISKASSLIDRFLTAFTDHRDTGPIIFSHFSLLLGLALPIWIAPILEADPIQRDVLSLSGLVALGIGDSFAAIVGTWSTAFPTLLNQKNVCFLGMEEHIG